MNKRVLSSVLALALIFGSAAAMPKTALPHSAGITAAAETSGDYDYRILYDGTAEITKYNGSGKTLVIPSTLGGRKVTRIGRSAFEITVGLKSVTIPNGVKSIGYRAFSDCTSLTSVSVPSSVTSIDNCAFSNCSDLENISIPSSLKRFGARAFSGTKWLENQQKKSPFVIVNTVLIDASQCSGKVTVPGGVTAIGESAFESADITDVVISNGVKLIDNSSFSFCKKLKSVKIPTSVATIEMWAFDGCTSLESITIPNGVETIDSEVFNNCTSLSSVSIPGSVNAIAQKAFCGCTALTSISVPSSVRMIGDKAFGYFTKADYSVGKIDGFTIFGEKDSLAQLYAKNNGLGFVPVSRLAGSSRYYTAADISKATYDKADTVVLAYSMNYADALAGVPLAAKLKAPILLTNTNSLDPATLAEIKRLGAKEVLILGGENAISKQVEQELAKESIATQRIAGATRFGTASQIAQQLNKKPTDVFFVYGFNYADALSVSTAAAQKNAPVIYLTTNGELNADTAAYLAELKENNCVKNAYVIGGDKVISDDMMNKAAAALGLSKATRIAGADRFETCVEVNKTFKAFLTGNKLCIATGMDFPDALAGGVYAAKNRSPLFLVNGKAKTPALNDAQKAYLKSVKIDSYAVFGGTGAVADKHIESIVRNK
ncbi:MAG: leucine-rich repeat protein [Ruminococcus sp.]|nr:leucine-rich repeat protein [Ruminococcus sp.]